MHFEKNFYGDSKKSSEIFIDFVYRGTWNGFLFRYSVLLTGYALFGDAYFDAKELSDIQVTGTMGVTGDDVEALQNLKDIETAEGVCLKDVLTGEEGQRKVLRILSIPEKAIW